MSFLDHLEALRWHLIRSFAAILVISIIAFLFKDIVFDKIILGPMQTDFFTYRAMCYLDNLLVLGGVICIQSIPFTIFNLEMSGQFTSHITISAVTGIVVAFPYIFWELWSFIRPGLLDNEQRYVRGVVFFASLLFFVGVLFGYFVIAPLSINFLGSYQVSTLVDNQINLGSYVSTITSITLAAAIVFELPIVVYFLSKAGFITPTFMKAYRRHAIVGALILGAIITPPDVTSQLLVTFPLVILYELSIFISAYVLKEKIKTANTEKYA